MFFQKIILFIILLKGRHCLSNPNLSYLLTYPSLSKTFQPSATDVADSEYNENYEITNILTPKPSVYLQPPPLPDYNLQQDNDQAYIAQDQNLYKNVIPKKKTILVYPKKYVPEPKKQLIKWQNIEKTPVYMEPENMYIKPSSYQFMIKPVTQNTTDLLTDYEKVPSTFMTPPKITHNVNMAELVPITYAPSAFEANPSTNVYKEPDADYSYDDSYAIIPKYETSTKYVQNSYLPNNFKYAPIKEYPVPKYQQFETTSEKYQNAYIPEQFSTESVNNYNIYSSTPKYHKFETASEKYPNAYIPEQFTTESIKNYNVYSSTPKYHKLETSSEQFQNSYLPQHHHSTESVKDYDVYSVTPKYHSVETQTENLRNAFVPQNYDTESTKDFGSIYKAKEQDFGTYAAVPNFDSYSLIPEFSQDDEESKPVANAYSTIPQNVPNYNPTETYSNFARSPFVKAEETFSKNPFLNKPKEYMRNPFLNTFDQASFLDNNRNINSNEKKYYRKKKKYVTIPNRFASSQTARPLIERSSAENRQFAITENPRKIYITTENIQTSTEKLQRKSTKRPENFEETYDIQSEPSLNTAITRELNQEASLHLSNISPSHYNNPKNERLQFEMHGHQGPHSYKFGFDTGKGHERQFRYEERDKEGVVKGHYGFYDKEGKLRVVNYDADPHTGFHSHPEDTE